eukprot:scaffold810_cov355-Pavlova_lutheri.AAC.19
MCRCSALPLRRIGTPRQPHATHCHVAFSIGCGTTILAVWQGKDAKLDGPYARAGSPRASTLGGDGVHVTPPCTGVLSAPGTPQSDRPRPRHLGPPGDGMDGAYAPHNRHNDQPLGTIETKVVAVQCKRSRHEGRQDKASRERL